MPTQIARLALLTARAARAGPRDFA